MLLNLMIVWFLTGLWHGANWNYVIWGVYFGVLLMIEKVFLLKRLERTPSWMQHFYALFLVMIGWVVFYFEKTPEMFAYFGHLFTFANGLIGPNALALFLTYLPLMLIAGFASTPAARRIYEKIRDRKAVSYAEIAACAVVLVLCTSTLVSQSYNPFLYFRF